MQRYKCTHLFMWSIKKVNATKTEFARLNAKKTGGGLRTKSWTLR